MDELRAAPARVVGGPRIVSISTEEEATAVIASGADELLAAARSRGGGWSGPGGRSSGSGIALRKFDAASMGSEGIASLLPRGSSAPAARRAPGVRGLSPRKELEPKRPPVVGGPPRARPADPARGDGRRPGVDLDKYTSTPGASAPMDVPTKAPAHGRRAPARVASAGAKAPTATATPAAAVSRDPPKAGRRVAPKGGGGGGAASSAPAEEVAAPTPRTGFTSKPSASLDPQKAASPFGVVKGKTKFSTYYGSGRIPVRIDHFGTGKNRIQWDTPIGRVNGVDLIPVCAEGIRETVHPLCFMARQMFKELVAAPDASRAILPSLPAVARSLRMAMADTECFEAGMEAVGQLSAAVGPALDPMLPDLCSQLAKHSMEGKYRSAVWKTLQTLEEHGGPEAYMAIKRKVPTYTTVKL